jgi:hypothetical protein
MHAISISDIYHVSPAACCWLLQHESYFKGLKQTGNIVIREKQVQL